MEDLFGKVLDDDEKLIKVFKPVKLKMFFSSLFAISLYLLIFVLFSIIIILMPEEGATINAVFVLIPISIFILILALFVVFLSLYYKNLYYAYTNKRLIIRSGIFGIDYKSLDMGMIGAINVKVSLFDKILKRNTGSLSFGSTASPISNGAISAYNFRHIVKPYETCKEIKNYINEFKKENK